MISAVRPNPSAPFPEGKGGLAPPLGPVWLATGLGLAVLIGSAPLEFMLPFVVAAATLVGMLIEPLVGLCALLVAIPFSPSLGLEETTGATTATPSISIFEPLALVMLSIWLARGMARQEIKIHQSGIATSLFFLLLTLLIAASSATSLTLATKEILKWLLLGLVFLFTALHVRDESRARLVLAVLFLAGSGHALMGVVQFFAGLGPPNFAVGDFMRAHGNFGQPNPFAGYLGTIFPLALAFSAVRGPASFRLLSLFTVLCTGLGIALSLSRGAWLGLAFGAAVMALVWSPRTRRLIVPTLAVGLLVGLFGAFGALPPALAERLTSTAANFSIFDARQVQPTPENVAVVERMAHWQAGWEMFLDHPFRGVGPGNYPAVYDQYSLPGWREALGHAHNFYLNMAAEAGVPGLVALLLLMGAAFRAIGAGLRTEDSGLRDRSVLSPQSSFSRALLVGLLGSLVVLSTHNMFDNLLVHGVGIQVGMLLGLIGGEPSRW